MLKVKLRSMLRVMLKVKLRSMLRNGSKGAILATPQTDGFHERKKILSRQIRGMQGAELRPTEAWLIPSRREGSDSCDAADRRISRLRLVKGRIMIVAVIGLGSFGFKTATRLYERGIDVLAIDLDSELVERVKDRVTHAVSINITDERSLRALNISDIDLAIVAIGDNIEMSIMAVASLRKLGVGRVIARAANQIHEHVLREIGASEIVKVEEEMGDLVASRILAPHILNHFYFAAGYSLVEIKAGKLFEGKTIVEAKIKQNYSLNVVAIQKRVPYITDEGKTAFKVEINDTPMPMNQIEEDDVLVLVGADQNFDRLFQDIGQ